MMFSTEGTTFFLTFFFNFYPQLIKGYRKYEKFTIKIGKTKEQIRFLKQCLEEKVLPRSLRWLYRVDVESPFPQEAIKHVKGLISEVKEDLELLFCKQRDCKRFLQANIKDDKVWKSLKMNADQVACCQIVKVKDHLDEKLSKLVEKSPWCTFSNVSNVINLSSITLSKDQQEMLSYGLNFSLPHETKHLIDFTVQLDRYKHFKEEVNYNFILMNSDSIFSSLKTNLHDFLPKRYLKALNDLKKNKSIRVC